MTLEEYTDRVAGCLVGIALGDGLGAPFEGLPPDVVRREFGGGARVVRDPPQGALTYTDDTQMTLVLAEHLARRGEIDPDALALEFACQMDPARGYGAGTRQLLGRYLMGEHWRKASFDLYPGPGPGGQGRGGSFGNGAAMRAHSVGLAFPADLDRVSDQVVLSAVVTHGHELALDAARMVALATALVVRPGVVEASSLFTELASRVATEEFGWQLRRLARSVPDDALPDLGNTVAAHRSVGTALACFAASPDDFSAVVARAIDFGGDTDTLAAIAGGLAGARAGLSRLPSHLISRLEDGEYGRDYVIGLSARFARRFHC